MGEDRLRGAVARAEEMIERFYGLRRRLLSLEGREEPWLRMEETALLDSLAGWDADDPLDRLRILGRIEEIGAFLEALRPEMERRFALVDRPLVKPAGLQWGNGKPVTDEEWQALIRRKRKSDGPPDAG